MSSFGAGLTVAVVLVWLGMVVAISFIEAPLKFTAPGVTLAIGLGIGRKVFRALNTVEAVLALVAVVGLVLMEPGAPGVATLAIVVAVVSLAVQVVAIRPALTRRSNQVLAGDGTTAADRRSNAHFYYVGFEVAKVVALVVAAVALLLNG